MQGRYSVIAAALSSPMQMEHAARKTAGATFPFATKRLKARLGDALIAQSCIDAHVVLLTRDRDFRTFAEAAKLDFILGTA